MKSSMTWPMMCTVVVAAVILLPATARATPEDTANDVSGQIMSPYCPGVTLHDCPSDAAVALRDRIESMAARGLGRAEIIAMLEREYSESIRAVPPASGTGLGAWLLPGLAALAGGVMGWLLLRRWVRIPTRPVGYDESVHITPADRRRLDSELKKLRDNA